jgi:superfamily II DNA or RNA helicase/HKD family nuclease
VSRPLTPGLYESLITTTLGVAIDEAKRDGWWADIATLDPTLLPDLLARHVQEAARSSIAAIGGEPTERLAAQVSLVNEVLRVLRSSTDGGSSSLEDLGQDGQVLRELQRPSPIPISRLPTRRPGISLGESALLVNGHRDYQIGGEVAREIASADRIDLLCAFVRFAGLRLIRCELEEFFARGGEMRVIASVYTGSTEKRAVDDLIRLGAKVKISYETSQTRLHAKAWLFRRNSEYHTAYIGSSNLTHAALVDGLEWNVRVSQVENPGIIDRVGAAFEQYWNEPSFVDYDPLRDGDALSRALERQGRPEPDSGLDTVIGLNIEFSPQPHQAQILEALDAERARGHYRNLVVAATGTGKTWISAFDYQRLRRQGHDRLLFVAHQDQILQQSQAVFQLVLKDPAFGERFVAGERPSNGAHVFASIQSLHRHINDIDPEAWDFVIVDEFHHAESPTYRALLDRLRPKILLGLTATPERADGLSILGWFDNRIAAEIRLWQALEQGLLCPFHYFGVNDGTDLSGVTFTRGSYRTAELEGLYTSDRVRATRILSAIEREVLDPSSMRALGFCVGVAHAELMAATFTENGLPSVALSAASSAHDRRAAIGKLKRGDIRVIFTVDLFNEGVDIPEVDTILLLRPTESSTVFLQQLGRGLRWSEGKSVLTVLDFIGQAHRSYRFDVRDRSLVGGTRKQLGSTMEQGFPFVPPGCAIRLDPIAQKTVLENVRSSLQLGRRALLEDLRALPVETRLPEFLDKAGYDLEELYARPAAGHTFTALRREAGFDMVPQEPVEEPLAKAIGRMLHVNDDERIRTWLGWLMKESPPPAEPAGSRNGRLQLMFFALLGQGRPVSEFASVLDELWSSKALKGEMVDLLTLLDDRSRARTKPLVSGGSVPLHSHANYTLREITAAYDRRDKAGRLMDVREGVLQMPSDATDLLFVTLQKSDADYSPTTRYQDYPIAPTLFHWESQNATAEASTTGRRYVEHVARGSQVILFVRDRRRDDRGEAVAYRCLGFAQYVKHQGERPMRITWRLEREMPGEFFQSAKVAAG